MHTVAKAACLVLSAVLYFTLPSVSVNARETEESTEAWKVYLKSHFSEKAFRTVFPVESAKADREFGEWYLSGVFLGMGDNRVFYVIQIYDGDEEAGFRPGFLVVANSHGQTLDILERQRIHSSLVEGAAKFPVLPDLSGNGESELPTERWTEARSYNFAIYRLLDGSVDKLASIDFVRGADASDVHWSALHVARLQEGVNNHGFAIKGRLFGPADEKLTSRSRATHGYAKTRVISTQPHRVLATFSWSEERGMFSGPQHGPGNTWQVLNETGSNRTTD